MTEISNTSLYWNNLYFEFHNQQNNNRNSIWDSSASPYLINIIPFLREKGVKKIMDTGCGDGRNLIGLLSSGFDEVVGVDFSEEALKIARKNVSQFNNVKLYNFSLDNIQLPENSFDAIICDNVLTHIHDVSKVLEQFHKLVKPGGYVLLEFTSVKDPNYGKGEQVSKNAFLYKGVYFKLYESVECESIVSDAKFKILKHIKQGAYTHPAHGANYARKDEKHTHYSDYLLVQK